MKTRLFFITLTLALSACAPAELPATPTEELPTITPIVVAMPTTVSSPELAFTATPGLLSTITPTVTPVTSSQLISLANVASLSRLAQFAENEDVFDIAWSPDSRNLAFVNPSGIFIHSLDTGIEKRILDLTEPKVRSDIAYSPDGDIVAFADMKVQLWDIQTGELLQTFDDEARAIDFSPDGRHLVSASGSQVLLWDVASGQQVGAFVGENNRGKMREVVYAPNGDMVAAGNSAYDVFVWEVDSGEIKFRLATGFPAYELAFSPDNRLLAMADSSGILLNLWDLDSGQLHTLATQTYLNGISFSHEGDMLATAGGTPNFIELWDIGKKEQVMQFEVANQAANIDAVNDISFSPDGRMLASAGGSGSGVVIWGIALP